MLMFILKSNHHFVAQAENTFFLCILGIADQVFNSEEIRDVFAYCFLGKAY